MQHRLATPYSQRAAFGRALDECAECGALVEIPHVAICARGDLCIVCSEPCKAAHEATHGYGACADCSDIECEAHQIESAAVFAARKDGRAPKADASNTQEVTIMATEQSGISHWCTDCGQRIEGAPSLVRESRGNLTEVCADCAAHDNSPEYQRFLTAFVPAQYR